MASRDFIVKYLKIHLNFDGTRILWGIIESHLYFVWYSFLLDKKVMDYSLSYIIFLFIKIILRYIKNFIWKLKRYNTT